VSVPRPNHAMTPEQTREWVKGVGEWAERISLDANALSEQCRRLVDRMDPEAAARSPS
jgi:hypothetical protein